MAEKPADKIYFANLPTAQLGDAIFERIKTYQSFVHDCGLYSLWRLSYQSWYSQDEDGFNAHTIGKKGPKGKFAVLKFNHFRSIVKNWRSLAQSQRAAMQPVAKFEDSDSDQQVKRAKVVLDHYAKASRIDDLKDKAINLCSYLGAAHLEQYWNDSEGSLVLPPEDEALTGGPPPAAEPPMDGAELPPEPMPELPEGSDPQPEPAGPPQLAERKVWGSNGEVRTGTIEANVYSPIHFIVDPMRQDAESTWCITERFVSKYDIAARYATSDEMYAKIIGLSRAEDEKLKLEVGFARRGGLNLASDQIPLYTFWHEKTPACRPGKRVLLLSPEIVLKEEDLPERMTRIPVQRIAPANIDETPFGYTEAWDLLAPQKAIDTLKSIRFSNIKTFGAGNILSPKGSGLKATAVTEGLNLLEYNVVGVGAEPKALQMPATPPDAQLAEKAWVGEMGTLIGVNSVARGDPEKSLESGAALALVQAQAVQYSSDFQGEIVKFESGVACDTIVLTQEFLKAEQEFAIVGDEIATLDKFTGAELDQVLRVDVKPVNPMTKTMGGRWQLGTFLAQTYPEKVTPEQLIQMVGTGTLDPITDDTQTEARNIQRENELLGKGIGPPPKVPMTDPAGQPVIGPDGQPKMSRPTVPGKRYVRALLTDNPFKHALKHIALLDSPAARDNPKIVMAVLDHLEDHEELYAFLTASRPGLLQMLRIEPMQAAIPPMMPPPDAAAGGAAAAEQQTGGGVRPSPSGPPGGGKEAPPDSAGPAKMPQFPKNPASGERFQPPAPPGG